MDEGGETKRLCMCVDHTTACTLASKGIRKYFWDLNSFLKRRDGRCVQRITQNAMPGAGATGPTRVGGLGRMEETVGGFDANDKLHVCNWKHPLL